MTEPESQPLTAATLCTTRCVPCEGGVPRMTPKEAEEQLKELPGWELLTGPDRIRKSWTVKSFLAGLEFFQSVAAVAEAEAVFIGRRSLRPELRCGLLHGSKIGQVP